MIITKATNVTIFFTGMEYELLCKWLKEAHHITTPRIARFMIGNTDPLKHTFDLTVNKQGNGYQLSENTGSSQHPWRVSFPVTQMSVFGNFNKIPVEVSINGAAEILHMKMNKDAISQAAANPVQITRTRKNPLISGTKEEKNFEPKVIVDVPLPDDPGKVMTLSDFIFSVQDLNHYLKSNSAITVQVKNNRIVYLISND